MEPFNNRDFKFADLNNDFQTLSEILISQFVFIENFLEYGWKNENFQRFLDNEAKIDELELIMMQKIPTFILQHSPKASNLRKVITGHEVILLMEQIGDYLYDIIKLIEKMNLESPDYKEIIKLLRNLFLIVKDRVHNAAFSFYTEDVKVAYEIFEQRDDDRDINFHTNLTRMLVGSFQDIPLTGEDLMTIMGINNMSCIISKIEKIAVSIAKSTTFVVEGVDLRHRDTNT